MPRLHDLGVLHGTVLLYGGPYSNLQATRALFARANALDIPPARRICTGDVLAYCADVRATLDLVRAEGGSVTAGNCEIQLGQGAEDCACGFDPSSRCAALSLRWYAHADAALEAEDRRWLASRPERVLFTHGGRRYVVIHGGASDISRFLWPSSGDAEFSEEIALLRHEVGPFDAVIAGHCGLAFRRRIGEVDWINPGVIGMPANDGSPETSFALLDEGGPRFQRLSYDAEGARDAMHSAGLTQGYAACLMTGIWPSQDVLPEGLRRPLPAQDVMS